MYRPGEWEQLPSERDLNPFSRYEALEPKRTIILDDFESTLSETGERQRPLWTFTVMVTLNSKKKSFHIFSSRELTGGVDRAVAV